MIEILLATVFTQQMEGTCTTGTMAWHAVTENNFMNVLLPSGDAGFFLLRKYSSEEYFNHCFCSMIQPVGAR